MPTMNWRTMKMPKASAARGRITPQGEFSRPSQETIMNSGTRITWIGTISAPRMAKNSRLRPGKRNLAKV